MKYRGFHDESMKKKQEKLNTRQCNSLDGNPKLIFPTELDAKRYVNALLILKNKVVHHYYCGFHKGYHVGHDSRDWEKQHKLNAPKEISSKVLTNNDNCDIIS